jgi:hypothetical protein
MSSHERKLLKIFRDGIEKDQNLDKGIVKAGSFEGRPAYLIAYYLTVNGVGRLKVTQRNGSTTSART